MAETLITRKGDKFNWSKCDEVVVWGRFFDVVNAFPPFRSSLLPLYMSWERERVSFLIPYYLQS